MDARQFFSAGIDSRGNLPQSLLRTTYNEVAAGIIPAHLNVPYSRLLGHDAPGEAPIEEETVSARPGAVTGTTWNKTFRHVPPPIKTILQGGRSKYPVITIAEIMAAHAPPLLYTQVKLCNMRTLKKRRKKQSRVIPTGDSHVNQ
jgi:hypothetical protein